MSIQAPALNLNAPSTAVPAAPSAQPRLGERVSATRDVIEQPRVQLAQANNPGLVLASPQASKETPPMRMPRNLCYRPERCGVEMSRIWNAFQAGGQVDLSRVPHVFSGNVYYMASSYDPNHAHQGAVLLDRQADGTVTFNGRWTFFAPPDNRTTVEEARRWSANHYPVTERGDHLYVNLTPNRQRGEVPVEYWLREDPATHDIYVIGFMGNGQFVLGELKPNPVPLP